jgi:hypothetical protein
MSVLLKKLESLSFLKFFLINIHFHRLLDQKSFLYNIKTDKFNKLDELKKHSINTLNKLFSLVERFFAVHICH